MSSCSIEPIITVFRLILRPPRYFVFGHLKFLVNVSITSRQNTTTLDLEFCNVIFQNTAQVKFRLLFKFTLQFFPNFCFTISKQFSQHRDRGKYTQSANTWGEAFQNSGIGYAKFNSYKLCTEKAVYIYLYVSYLYFNLHFFKYICLTHSATEICQEITN